MRKLFLIAALAAALVAQEPGRQAGRAGPAGGVQGRLTWFDRQGKVVGTAGDPGLYRTFTISPDGKRVAFERNDPATQNRDIWVLDFASGVTTRFTSDPGWEAFPTWSPDGSRIVFTSNRTGVYELYQKASSGAGQEALLYQSSEGKGPTSWSPDGKYLIYYSLGQPTHLRVLAVAGPPDRKPMIPVDPQFSSITADSLRTDAGLFTLRTNRAGMRSPYARSMRPRGRWAARWS